MFDPINPKQSFPALEHGILQYWQEEDTFKRSVKQRSGEKASIWDAPKRGATEQFTFFDGPPFATGLPHYGHLLAGTIKDVIPRYQTMRGKKVDRRFGWDCHGLPVENLVEEEQGLKSKREIEERGIAWFNEACRSSVQRYTAEWRKTVERMGRWVDMDWDYRTMDPDYMEGIWWVFKELWEKGLIEEGEKSMHLCPRCSTPLSNFEVTLGYKEITDWTTITTYPLVDDPTTALLAWTTTSWTLPGNLFLAVGPDISYAKVRAGERMYIVAEALVEKVFQGIEYELIDQLHAKELIGKRYEPVFPYFVKEYEHDAFRVVEGEFVTTEDGTGIVHIAPGFGSDDYELGQREGVQTLSHITREGKMVEAVEDFAGQEVRPMNDPQRTDKAIAVFLKERGRLFAQGPHIHSYPHCWRCDSPLINYTTSSWFVRVEKIKEDLLKANAQTHWVPAHIRDGRFGEWLKNARDWAISRNRYWGTPIPIWRDEKGAIEVIGSRDELMSKAPERFTKITALRHAESEGNLIPIYQGKVPGTNLTEKGKGQAREAAKQLTDRAVSAIYASPLARTQQTAEAIAKAVGVEVTTDERLREVHFGEYEGKTIDFSDLKFVKERRAHKLEKEKPESIYHFDGMETWSSVQERIGEFFAEVLPKHKGQHIVVVTHADPMVNIKHFFMQQDPVKLSHQPYPRKADPHTYYFDHERGAQMDLHRETVDAVRWDGMERIPEVLDCWFESGSMPYAQGGIPSKGEIPVPADFIAEGLDQTRGWFYTLMVLSSALYKLPAFKHCVVNGIVLAEDGKKMSKRLKNYPEPNEIMEKYGADAMRFTLMGSPAVRAEHLRFSQQAVEETLRKVILPFWNVYSFFVLHANEAGWEPIETRTHSAHPLDAWIRVEVQDLTNRMTEQLDAYDLSASCSELFATLDALTNWYVRRSRRRFAGKEGEEERVQALTTLHEVLIMFSQLLAPICPFITEAIYLNLVPKEHGSIHLTDWPQVRELTQEEHALIKRTRLLRTIVSLGLKLRAEANVKVRQPLTSVKVALSEGDLSDTDRALLVEELNVKDVQLLDDATAIAGRTVEVHARVAGPRLGAKVQEIIRAAKAGEFTQENGNIVILGEKLQPEEAQVVWRGREGESVASERGVVVALDTNLTDDLRSEGWARDVVRLVQALRKEKGLKVSDRITLTVEEEAEKRFEAHRALIECETNGSREGEGELCVRIDGRNVQVVGEAKETSKGKKEPERAK